MILWSYEFAVFILEDNNVKYFWWKRQSLAHVHMQSHSIYQYHTSSILCKNGKFWIGLLLFVYWIPILKLNGCYWYWLYHPLTHILILIYHKLPLTQIILDNFLNLTEDVHPHRINQNIKNTGSYMILYKSEGILLESNSSNGQVTRTKESLDIFWLRNTIEILDKIIVEIYPWPDILYVDGRTQNIILL